MSESNRRPRAIQWGVGQVGVAALRTLISDVTDVITRTHGAKPHLTGILSGFLRSPMCQPDDITDAVLWLAGDESKFVTVNAIAVDGGNSQYWPGSPCGTIPAVTRSDS
jgi:hypothetical protein